VLTDPEYVADPSDYSSWKQHIKDSDVDELSDEEDEDE
jgi:hypothetical protein